MQHIDKVKNLRGELEVNWGKENYFRKEMQDDQLPPLITSTVSNVLADAWRSLDEQ